MQNVLPDLQLPPYSCVVFRSLVPSTIESRPEVLSICYFLKRVINQS